MMTRRASEAASSVLNFLAGRKLLSHAETLIKAAKSSTKIAARTFGLYTTDCLLLHTAIEYSTLAGFIFELDLQQKIENRNTTQNSIVQGWSIFELSDTNIGNTVLLHELLQMCGL